MKMILISRPEIFADEAQHVQRFFQEGLDTFHLRKPGSSIEDFEDALRQFAAMDYKRIVIHNHYELVEKYNLKGLHLTEWFTARANKRKLKEVINTARNRKLTVSGSFHSIEALEDLTLKFHYVFLGPVFNSISKKGYMSAIDLDRASEYLRKPKNFEVVALGGIHQSNITLLAQAGFHGVALLGSVWHADDPLSSFRAIKKCIET